MFKKINNYYLSSLIVIIFILNITLFQAIKMSKAQGWELPEQPPGQETSNIVTSPLSADLDLGSQSIIGDGSININGSITAGDNINMPKANSKIHWGSISPQSNIYIGAVEALGMMVFNTGNNENDVMSIW